MVPGTIVYVYFGTTVSNISDAASGNFDGGVLQLVLLIAGSVLAFVGVCYVSYVARKEVKKVLAKQKEEKEAGEDENKVMDASHNGADDEEANKNLEMNNNEAAQAQSFEAEA